MESLGSGLLLSVLASWLVVTLSLLSIVGEAPPPPPLLLLLLLLLLIARISKII